MFVGKLLSLHIAQRICIICKRGDVVKNNPQSLNAIGPFLTGSTDFSLVFNDLPVGVTATDAEGFITY